MTNLFGLCCLALAFFITAMPEASPEHVVIKPDSYQQAEHFGCQEVAKVCRILSDPQFAALFGPGSLAEAPLAATLADGRVIAGTVDRILVEETKVSVIDFKTGKVPATDAKIPNSHRAQMNAYAEALRVIFPGRAVRTSLLYTAGPKLIELTP